MERDRAHIACVTAKSLAHVHIVQRPKFAETRPGRGGDQLVVRTQLAAGDRPGVAYLTANYFVFSQFLEELLLGGGLKRFVGGFCFDSFDSGLGPRHRIVGYPDSGISQLARALMIPSLLVLDWKRKLVQTLSER